MYTAEICTGSYEDCLAAQQGGASRVELNSALCAGGLTPTVTTLRQVKKDTSLKVICMVRPRAAGFCYSESESELMLKEAEELLKNGADGIAFGFLTPQGKIEETCTKRMTDLIHSYAKEAVFHRAFDVTPDADEAIETLIDLQVDRLLTSGQKNRAMDGVECIRHLQEVYGQKIQILAGSGMNADNAKEMLLKTGITQIHSSCKSYKEDKTTSGNDVSYAYLSEPYQNCYDVVSPRKVQAFVTAVEK